MASMGWRRQLFELNRRLRPDVGDLPPSVKQFIYLELFIVEVLAPAFLIGLVWLVAVTDWEELWRRLPPFFLLGAALFFTQQRPFETEFATRSGKRVPIIVSLSSILMWGGFYVWGPLTLWVSLVTMVLNAVLDIRRQRQLDRLSLWSVASRFLQENQTLASLLALAVFEALGGRFPFEPLLNFRLPLLLFVPILVELVVQIGILTGAIALYNFCAPRPENRLDLSLSWFGGVILFNFVETFAILGAITYSWGGQVPFFIFVLTVALVNWLLNTLSQSNARTAQRAREMSELEALSEAILQADPDHIPFGDLLLQHMPLMFPNDQLEIWLDPRWFGEEITVCSQLNRPPVRPGDRDEFAAAAEEEVLRHDLVPPHMARPLGQTVLLKIKGIRLDVAQEGDDTLGLITMSRSKARGLAAESLPALQSLASQIALAFYRQQSFLQTVAHQRTTRELELAGQIQNSFLPRSVPDFARWQLTATIRPARQTSGDFYDFIPLGDGRLGVLIADVADKGTGAALYMALSRTLLRTFATTFPDRPGQVLQAANERILADTGADQFVTVFYGVISPDGRMVYSSGGHNPVLYLSPGADEEPQWLGQTGIPLGMFEGMSWREETLQLGRDDLLVLYTDGVTEAQNEEREEFGEARLLEVVRRGQANHPQALAADLLTEIGRFCGAAPPFDDITLVMARFEGDSR